MSRLDRCLCNIEWRESFPEATIHHLPHAYSDHCLLLLKTTKDLGLSLGGRPFRFQATWFEHNDFFRTMESKWNHEGTMHGSLKKLSEDFRIGT